jgi:hypothetical protein
MKLEKKWKAAHDAVVERYYKLPEEVVPFRVKVESIYPLVNVVLEKPGDQCSLCARKAWWDLTPAQSHVGGLPHFRQWCIEHPGEVRDRFPEAVGVLAEATLTEVLK